VIRQEHTSPNPKISGTPVQGHGKQCGESSPNGDNDTHTRIPPKNLRHRVITQMAASYQAKKNRLSSKQKRWAIPQWAHKLFSFVVCGASSAPHKENANNLAARAGEGEVGRVEAEGEGGAVGGGGGGGADAIQAEVENEREGVLYDGAIDEQVAGARTWDDIRNVTDEYLRRFHGEDEIIPFDGFDESLDEAESGSATGEGP
jgi:hypothetical protein